MNIGNKLNKYSDIEYRYNLLAIFVPKNIIFLFGKKSCKYRFRFVFAINSFLLQTIHQGQNSNAAHTRTTVDAYI